MKKRNIKGDAWTNNMLIRVNKDKSVSNTFGAFIDWSMLFEGKIQFMI
jgi:hypothetical protein